MNIEKENMPWILFSVSGVTYAVSCSSVLSLNHLSKVTPLPSVPPEVRGVIDFRGQLIQLIDTRTIFGIKSTTEEINDFFQLMDSRRQDHINWLSTLEQTVLEDKEFTLTTDPHQCAFGKWYDSYDANNKNIMFMSTFVKFDKPHKAIHQIAVRAKDLIDKGQKNVAVDLIESVKETELKQMIGLFDDIKEAYEESRRELTVVIGDDSQKIALAVDEVVAIENLSEFDDDLIKHTMTNTEYLTGVGKRKNGAVVFILNDDFIINTFSKKF